MHYEFQGLWSTSWVLSMEVIEMSFELICVGRPRSVSLVGVMAERDSNNSCNLPWRELS